MFVNFHIIDRNQGESAIDRFSWLAKKTITINPINKNDNKYFQYTRTVALNHIKTGKNIERISTIQSLYK